MTATDSRHSTSRGQARQTLTRASSSATSGADRASAATSSGVPATGVSAVAGSPGHPVPGGTGEGNGRPVTGWAQVMG